MTTRCLTVEEIVRLQTADAADPGHDHVASCARCGALALEYAEFARARPVGDANVRDAAKRLDTFIRERIERSAVTSAGERRSPRRWFDFAPRRTLMLTAAAALLVIVAVSVMRTQFAPEPMILRGTGEDSRLATYSVAASGSIPLLWAPVEGAEAYRITILREDLTAFREIGPVTGNTYVFAPAEHTIPAGRYFWEVTALANGDSLGSLGPAPLFVR